MRCRENDFVYKELKKGYDSTQCYLISRSNCVCNPLTSIIMKGKQTKLFIVNRRQVYGALTIFNLYGGRREKGR